MIKKDLYVLIGISVFAAIFFLVSNNDAFQTTTDKIIGQMGGIGILVVPILIGIMKFKRSVKTDA